MAPIAGLVVGGVFDLLKGWISKKFPDPTEARKAEQELQQFLAEKDQNEVKQFYDFVTSYEGMGKDVAPELQIYRGSVRPTITYLLIISFIYGVWDSWNVEMLELIFKLNLISLTFWYGERAMKNLGVNFGNTFKKGS